MYKILLFGPQGSGKGTQAVRLSASLMVPALSMGQLLRDVIARGDELGLKFASIMDAGNLVSDQDAISVLKLRLQEQDAVNGYIIDGYPRNQSQYEVYVSFDKPTHVIVLDLSDEEALRRLTGRRTCKKCGAVFHIEFHPPKMEGVCDLCGGELGQRNDETSEATRRRLEIYHNDTLPVLAEYEKLGIVHYVDGSKSMDQVEEEIKKYVLSKNS
ncbi:MAG: nucleoside monophosphate kinase [Patescibacteria group bacterium]